MRGGSCDSVTEEWIFLLPLDSFFSFLFPPCALSLDGDLGGTSGNYFLGTTNNGNCQSVLSEMLKMF